MSPVWGHRLEGEPEELSISYCAGRDVRTIPMADEILIPFDIWNTEAHNIMLYRQGIISRDELKVILSALLRVRELHEAGNFQLDPQKEDVHMNIESFITALQALWISRCTVPSPLDVASTVVVNPQIPA